MAGVLAGQHAFVTGGGSGIGRACARALLVDGARVTVSGRSRDKLEQTVAALGELGEIDYHVVDVARETGVQAAVEAGIRVNSVCPGLVDTEIAAGLFATKSVDQDCLDCMPIGRTGIPADVASAGRFLCGPESSWITGVNLSVDGGHHLRRGPDYQPFIRALYGDDQVEGRL
jgi:NAD(P)-dependent dehydrogenase (short-subunit alcohol dehydrogenase family)